MKRRLYLYGLWAMCGTSLALLATSAIQVWGRPVTAISGIAPYSDIISVSSGKVLRAPEGKYAGEDLQRDDSILTYDGRDWQEAQRLNWHELSERQVGDSIALQVQRRSLRVPVQLAVTYPDAWEQFVLLRYAMSGFFCWLPTVFILWTLTQAHRHQSKGVPPLPVEHSVLALWVLTFQMLGITHALASFKYPVAVLWTDALTPVVALLIGIISLPYPLAPHSRRSRWITYPLLALAGVAAAAIIWNALQSPFHTSDLRRSVQLLRPGDPLAHWILWVTTVGIVCAVVGMLAVAYSSRILVALHMISGFNSPLKLRWRKVIDWFAATYSQCPPTIQVIAQFQLMIISIYFLFDILPRLLGGVGNGYSVLFGGIPITYLILYSDNLAAKRWGQLTMNVIIALVAVIQIPNQGYRLFVGSYGKGANGADIASLLIVAWGTVAAALMIAFHDLFQKRESPLSALIDRLFSPEIQGSQQTLWRCLVNDVGRYIGTSTWLWAVLTPANEWQLIESSGSARREWLEDAGLPNELAKLAAFRPVRVRVDTLELPTLLILLPVYRRQGEIEVWVAANPQRVREMEQVIQRGVHERLQAAVSALRRLEEQRAIAEEKERLASTIEQLRRQQQTTARLDYLYADARLHRGPLGEMVQLTRDLEIQGNHDVSERIAAIQQSIRDILQNLGTYIVREQLLITIQRRIERWEEQHPGILLFLNASQEPALKQDQREAIYEIICSSVENALKHAAPTEIEIMVLQQAQTLNVEIRDNGRGFVYDRARILQGEGVEGRQDSHTPWGLLIMHILAERIGGQLDIQTAPGVGCQVVLALPYAQA